MHRAGLLRFAAWAVLLWGAAAMRADHLARLRRDTVDMFYHGYSNYMQHAFPEDELRPVTCTPLTRDRSFPGDTGLNDALGNYSLTLIDSLSTLAILAGGPHDGSNTGPHALRDFQDGIANFVLYYGDGRPGPSGVGIRATGFDLDSKVQVFETVIRGVGGLLSAHLFAIGELPIPGYDARPVEGASGKGPSELAPIRWPNGFKYDGQLLRLALDLAQRLLPAFYTPTGIPYPRVNLRTGIPFYVNSPLHQVTGGVKGGVEAREITETCSAGAGSLTLELTVLSRLTGDSRFENVAKRAFWEVWHRRSEIGLIGNSIDAEQGKWIGAHSGIGAGMDSFFEYALKSHILLSGHGLPNASASGRAGVGDWLDPASLHGPLPPEMHSSDAFLEAWHQAHASVKTHLYTDRHRYPYYSNNHRATGQPYAMWIDSLGAFYPGLLALAGETEEAVEANLVYTALWTRYSGLPERWSVSEGNVEAGIAWWPGRPEFIESTYHIYRATDDPWYLHVGEMVLKDIRRRCYTPCGWAGLQDVLTEERQDRMESFFLGETTKYLYLLFDREHPLNKLDAAFVFSTEGHPLILPTKTRTRSRAQHPGDGTKDLSVAFHYYDERFTNACPVAPVPANSSFPGSATAQRPQIFDASVFTSLYKTPNLRTPDSASGHTSGSAGMLAMVNGTLEMASRPASKHSLFPWTLPPSLLPQNGTCQAPAPHVVAAVIFPSSDSRGDVDDSSEGRAANALIARLGASLAWHSYAGPTIGSLDGLKLQLEREFSEARGENVWRITHAVAVQLGRHEKVFFHAEHVRHYHDEAFSCHRRSDAAEIEILLDDVRAGNATTTVAAETAAPSRLIEDSVSVSPPPARALLQQILSALFDASQSEPLPPGASSEHDATTTTSTTITSSGGGGGGGNIYSFYGNTAVGAGAFPLPSLRDTPTPASPGWDANRPATAHFPWRRVFLGGYGCDAPLPEAAPRAHQLIVFRRGGCAFSQKLDNIPNVPPSSGSLQLVVVVDEAAGASRLDGDVDRPLLADEQRTPRGGRRLHGVPLVLVRGEEGDYERFGRAVAAGMRRKYRVESQGLVIANAVVL